MKFFTYFAYVAMSAAVVHSIIVENLYSSMRNIMNEKQRRYTERHLVISFAIQFLFVVPYILNKMIHMKKLAKRIEANPQETGEGSRDSDTSENKRDDLANNKRRKKLCKKTFIFLNRCCLFAAGLIVHLCLFLEYIDVLNRITGVSIRAVVTLGCGYVMSREQHEFPFSRHPVLAARREKAD